MHRAIAIRKRACPARAETDADDQLALDRHHAPSRKATFSSERIIIPSHVHEQRRRVNQTVDPIQNSAVTGNSCSHVFGSDVALNHANRKIAQLPANSNDQASQNKLPRAKEWKRESKKPGQNHSDAQRSERAFPCLVRADFAAQRMAAENFPESKCRDVSQPRRENDVANKAVGVASVSDKSEVTEHPADVNKTDNGERYTPQLTASAIAQNRNEHDQRDRERRHGDKESVPARALFFATWLRN